MFDFFKKYIKREPKRPHTQHLSSPEDIKSLFRFEPYIDTHAATFNKCSFSPVRDSFSDATLTDIRVFITGISTRESSVRLILDSTDVNQQTSFKKYLDIWNMSPDDNYITINLDDIIIINQCRVKWIQVISSPVSLCNRFIVDVHYKSMTFNNTSYEIREIEENIKQYKAIIQSINTALLNDRLFESSDISLCIRNTDTSLYIKDKSVYLDIADYCHKQIKKLNKEKTYIKNLK